MGDRWNIHNDEIEARRYREDVPRKTRAWSNLRASVIVFGSLTLLIAAAVYGARQ